MQACQHVTDIGHTSRQHEAAEAPHTPYSAMCDEDVTTEEEVNIDACVAADEEMDIDEDEDVFAE